jgi:hypothetical protein
LAAGPAPGAPKQRRPGRHDIGRADAHRQHTDADTDTGRRCAGHSSKRETADLESVAESRYAESSTSPGSLRAEKRPENGPPVK